MPTLSKPRLLLLPPWLVLVTAVQAATPGAPATAACDARDTLATLSAQANRGKSLQDAVQKAFDTSPDLCSSIKAVLTRLVNTQTSGGRKLEKDKPFNPNSAAAEYAAIHAQAEFRTELAVLLRRETDPLRRNLLEAALLHDYGKFEARDRLLRQSLPE